MLKRLLNSFCLVAAMYGVTAAHAQSYGNNISLAQAKAVLTAAEAEAEARSWPLAIAIVDTAGQLVAYVKRDDTQNGSVEVSQAKARSAVLYKRPTKAFQDTVAQGGAGLRVLTLEGAVAAEGGIPLVLDGKIVGAIGVSGMASDQDSIVAEAGLAALK